MTTARTLEELPLPAIHPDPQQPRKDFDEAALEQLAASIKADGVREPILVRHDRGQGTYIITAGERRWRAARKAGLKTIPAIVEELEADQVRITQLVENLHREDLNALELATAYVAFRKATGETQAQLAKRLGLDQGTVSLQERLLDLPKSAKDLVAGGTLTRFHARELLRLKDEPKALEQRIRRFKEYPESAQELRRSVDGDLDRIRWAAQEQKQREKEKAREAKAAKSPKPHQPTPAEKKAAAQLAKSQAKDRAEKALRPFIRAAIARHAGELVARIRAIAARELRISTEAARWLLNPGDLEEITLPSWKQSKYCDELVNGLAGPLKKATPQVQLAYCLWLGRQAWTLDKTLERWGGELQRADLKKLAKKGGGK